MRTEPKLDTVDLGPAPRVHGGRDAPLVLPPEEFRRAGHALVDSVADFLARVPDRPVTPGESPAEVRALLDAAATLPEEGSDAGELLRSAAELLFGHSLLNGHPRFFGLASAVAARVPAPLWRSAVLRAAFAGAGARVLGIGRFALDGRTPLGQRFSLVLGGGRQCGAPDGEHLGPVAEPREQPRLGDFRIRRRGVFMLGRASFQPAPERLRAGGARTRGEWRWASGS